VIPTAPRPSKRLRSLLWPLLFAGIGSLSCGLDRDPFFAGRERTRFVDPSVGAVPLGEGPCPPGARYEPRELVEPSKIETDGSTLISELVVAIRERCLPVWVPEKNRWEMQTLNLRTYGFPTDPRRGFGVDRTPEDLQLDTDRITWSTPGPTFVMDTATLTSASADPTRRVKREGTKFKLRLYNRMPKDEDPHVCQVNVKCNTSGPNKGQNPKTGRCQSPIDPAAGGVEPFVPSQSRDGKVLEPPNCFHGANSTNFHFHGFHVSPQLGQDFVGLELRPPLHSGEQPNLHGTHGEHGVVEYGHSDFDVDGLRYSQAPGTHWYHAHKHGSTALQVLNGLVGTFEVRGEFDRNLREYFRSRFGRELRDRLMVVQQLQELTPGLGGADAVGAILVNGQAAPIVSMAPGEIQRWRLVGATMQASAGLTIGFADRTAGAAKPEVRQISMDGVQFSPQNYVCQPVLNQPDCTPRADETPFDELTSFELSPGNRIDLLIKAPNEPGIYCKHYAVYNSLSAKQEQLREAHARVTSDECVSDAAADTDLSVLLKIRVTDEPAQEMQFPPCELSASGQVSRCEFPALPPFLEDLQEVDNPKLRKNIHYEMVKQGSLQQAQFWINQTKYDPSCMNETVTLDVTEEWTLWNNSTLIRHPFHIHQNPFQITFESSRGTYTYPLWRDTIPIPTATCDCGCSKVEEALRQSCDLACGQLPRCPNVTPNGDTSGFSSGSQNVATPQQAPDGSWRLTLHAANWGSAKIRYVAKEFTGAFVNHCHILGHEDRGMMHNTQASCRSAQWGTTGPARVGTVCDSAGFCPSDCETGRPIPSGSACASPPEQRSDWPAGYGYSTAPLPD